MKYGYPENFPKSRKPRSRYVRAIARSSSMLSAGPIAQACSRLGGAMRRRSEPHSFEQRLEAHRQKLERELASLPSGRQRDVVAAMIEQLQSAAEMHEFLSLRTDVGTSCGAPSAYGQARADDAAKLSP